MNTALVLAGGVGQRVGAKIPKQFLEVAGKPIMVHTLEVFQDHPMIDDIVIVCVAGWEDEVRGYADRFGITKIRRVITGGETGMMSISNGVFGISDIADENSIIVVHDAVRPMISEDIVTDCIRKCMQFGNGCASIPLQETIVRTKDGISGNENVDRSEIMRVQTPQAYRYPDILQMYRRAAEEGVTNSVYANTLLMEQGGRVFFSKGSVLNIKVTTMEDMHLLKLIISSHEKK